MKTIEIQAYEYDELTDEAKYNVRHWLNEGNYYDECYEVVNSLKRHCALFNIDLENYSLGDYRSNYISTNARNHSFRYWDKRKVNSILEKMDSLDHYECLLLEYFSTQYKANHDVLNAFKDSLDYCIKIYMDTLEYSQSDEYAREMCNCNDYLFNEHGRII